MSDAVYRVVTDITSYCPQALNLEGMYRSMDSAKAAVDKALGASDWQGRDGYGWMVMPNGAGSVCIMEVRLKG